MFESAVVRLLRPDGQIQGTGFLLGRRLVCTCAHVVANAFGVDARGGPPTNAITVDFPLLDGPACTGRVLVWDPIHPDGTGDLAILELDSLPNDARPPRLAPAGGAWNDDLRMLGFPEGRDSGIWVAGKLRAGQATGWLQIEVPRGPQIARGFSGGPVWNPQAGGVIGVVVAAEHATTTAYMIPLQAVLDLQPVVMHAAIPPSPYRGLEPFREHDAAFFHGRTREAALLAEYAAHRPLVVVTGGSGSGKSSLVRASLVPKLKAEGSRVVDFQAKAAVSPSAQLTEALTPLREEERVVVFLDQFEEIVATEPGTARALFETVAQRVHAVPQAPGRPPRLQAILTLRSADLDGVLTSEHAEILRDGAVHLLPMGRSDLRDTVVEPVRAAGMMRFDPGLAEVIVQDAVDAPGQLPLVEFALTMLWERHHHGVLTHEAYTKLGRVSGALAGYADTVYRHQLPTQQERDFARRLLLQLVRPTEDGGFTLHRIPVDGIDPQLHGMVEILSRHRLVVTRDGLLALAHEALIRQWPTLAGWLNEDRDYLVWRDRLDTTFRLWREAGKDPGRLLRGRDLAIAEGRAAERPTELTEDQREFLTASQAGRRRGKRRWQAATAVITVLAVVAGSFAVLAQRRNTELTALLRKQAATALAEEAQRRADTAPLASLQFAQAAWQHDPGSPAATAAMLIQQARFGTAQRVQTGLWSQEITALVTSADSQVIAVQESDGAMTVWFGLGTPTPTSWKVNSGRIKAGEVELSDDGSRLAMRTDYSGIEVWNVKDRTGPIRLREPNPPTDPLRDDVTSLTLSPDGRRLAATVTTQTPAGSNQYPLQIFDVDTGQRLPSNIPSDGLRGRAVKRVDTAGTVWMSESSMTETEGHNVIRDWTTGRIVHDLHKGNLNRAGVAIECDLETNEAVLRAGANSEEILRTATSDCTKAEFDGTHNFLLDPTGQQADSFQMIHVLDVHTRKTYQIQTIVPPSGPQKQLMNVVHGPGGPEILIVNSSGVVRTRPLQAKEAPQLFRGSELFGAKQMSDGTTLAMTTGGFDRPTRLEVVDRTTHRQIGGEALATIDVDYTFSPIFTTDERFLLVKSRLKSDLIVISTLDFRVRRTISFPQSQKGTTWNLSAIPANGDEIAVLNGGIFTRWRVSTGEQLSEPLPLQEQTEIARAHAPQAYAVPRQGHPDQVIVITDNELQLWDVTNRHRIRTFRASGNSNFSEVATQGHSAEVAVHTTNGTLETWNPEHDGSSRPPAAMAADRELTTFAPGGSLIVRNRMTSKELEFWDITQGRSVARLSLPTSSSEWRTTNSGLLIGLVRTGAFKIDLNQENWLLHLCAINDRDYVDTERDIITRIPGADSTSPCRIEH